jgi:hypothetical protein
MRIMPGLFFSTLDRLQVLRTDHRRRFLDAVGGYGGNPGALRSSSGYLVLG